MPKKGASSQHSAIGRWERVAGVLISVTHCSSKDAQSFLCESMVARIRLHSDENEFDRTEIVLCWKARNESASHCRRQSESAVSFMITMRSSWCCAPKSGGAANAPPSLWVARKCLWKKGGRGAIRATTRSCAVVLYLPT